MLTINSFSSSDLCHGREYLNSWGGKEKKYFGGGQEAIVMNETLGRKLGEEDFRIVLRHKMLYVSLVPLRGFGKYLHYF